MSHVLYRSCFKRLTNLCKSNFNMQTICKLTIRLSRLNESEDQKIKTYIVAVRRRSAGAGASNRVFKQDKMASLLTGSRYSKEKSKSLYYLFFSFFWKTAYRQAISPRLPPRLPSGALSPCSVLRSTGELYLICDRIILFFSLHLVHAGDIAVEWENHWLVVGVCLCVCLCMCALCEVKGHYM